jgi:hypothetical protein
MRHGSFALVLLAVFVGLDACARPGASSPAAAPAAETGAERSTVALPAAPTVEAPAADGSGSPVGPAPLASSAPVAGPPPAASPGPGGVSPASAPTAPPSATAPGGATNSVTAPAEEPSLLAAARACVTQPSTPTFSLRVEAREGDFARVVAQPSSPSYDPLTVYLRKRGGEWRCVDYGTWFSCEELEEAGFPQAVRCCCD